MKSWHDLQPHLRQLLGDEEYSTWIAPLEVVQADSSSLTLGCPNAIVIDWVRDEDGTPTELWRWSYRREAHVKTDARSAICKRIEKFGRELPN